MILCVVAILFPFISAISILEGIKKQSGISIEEGADIYVSMDMYGRNGMIPYGFAREIEKIDGVIKAVPRVISRVYVEGKLLVLLGLPQEQVSDSVSFAKGSLPGPDEIVIGQRVAENLDLDIGSNLSIGVRVFAIIDHVPFIQKKIYRVSGIFDAESSIWTADLILMDVDEAISVYEMEDFVTDIAVDVRPGYTRPVAEAVQKMNAFFRIQTKEIAQTYVEKGFDAKGGVFIIIYTIALAIAIPAILVISGFGRGERRKEIGILKATGWKTQDVLEMIFFENTIIALISAPGAFVLSYLWVRFLNGIFLINIFVAGMDSVPTFPVPSQFTPMPLLLSFLFSLVLTMIGSIYSTWRVAVTPPSEAMR